MKKKIKNLWKKHNGYGYMVVFDKRAPKKKSKILKKVVEKTSGLWLYRCLKDERTLKICNYFFFIHEKVVYLGYEVLIEKNYPQCKLFF